MSVVVTVRNPGALVDRAIGIDGLGGLGGRVGLGDDIAQLVDERLAEDLGRALLADNVEADVYVSAAPPAPSDRGSVLLLLGVVLVAGILIGSAK